MELLEHHLLLLFYLKSMILQLMEMEMKKKRTINKIALQVMTKRTAIKKEISLNSLNNLMVQLKLQELKVLALLSRLDQSGRIIWHSGFSLS